MGFEGTTFSTGFVISKPPHSPPLYWHQDGVLWNHPISYTNKPQQYFLMYYLVDTDLDNGCLRVIPGSHLKRHALHDLGREAHQADEITRATNLDHPALRKAAGEIDVPVAAGDVVIGDSRLLHSAHANQSDQRRTVLTIWYWPDYDNLPEEVKGLITSSMDQNEEWCRWIEQTQSVTGSLVPVHEEGMEVVKRNNVAGESLR